MENNEIKKENLREEILGRIRRGEVKMHSRGYFLLKSLLWAIVAIFFLILTAALVVFVFYVLKLNGTLALTGFGLKGMREFLLSLPLSLIAITLLFILTAGVFMKQYPVTYRRPLIYGVGALLIIISLGSAAMLAATGLRRSIYATVEYGEIPLVSGFYDAYTKAGSGRVTVGRVVTVGRDGLTVETREGEQVRAVFGPQTSIYTDRTFETGDYVIVYGSRNGQTVGAMAVERVETE